MAILTHSIQAWISIIKYYYYYTYYCIFSTYILLHLQNDFLCLQITCIVKKKQRKKFTCNIYPVKTLFLVKKERFHIFTSLWVELYICKTYVKYSFILTYYYLVPVMWFHIDRLSEKWLWYPFHMLCYAMLCSQHHSSPTIPQGFL